MTTFNCPLLKPFISLFKEEEFTSLLPSISLRLEHSSALSGCVSVLHPSPLIPPASRDPRSRLRALQLPLSSTPLLPDEGGMDDGVKLTASSITQLHSETAEGVTLPDTETLLGCWCQIDINTEIIEHRVEITL